ncbi:MAG: PAS domain-containing sensor histidine kinase [Bacteroidetes bacterium]|nr:MAG: PAS domain-containing sensor histidine kinase [Bacteroidota bacterium]TAG86444.1 MAG: PAS domain-containing sensor histidine kinase [Bacteroidota bacterium]
MNYQSTPIEKHGSITKVMQNNEYISLLPHQQMQAWFDAAPQASYLIGTNGEVFRVNNLGKEYAKNYGLKTDTWENIDHLKFAEIFHLSNANEYFSKASNGQKISFEHKIQQKYVGEVWLEIEYIPLIGNENNITGIALTVQDITLRKKAKAKILAQKNQLEELNRVKDRLFSVISHDFRSPLASLRSFFNLLKVQDLETNQIQNILQKIDIQLATTTDFLDNILFWTKSQMNGLQLEAKNLALKNIVDNIFNLLMYNLQEKNIIVENLIDNNDIVYADLNTLQLVLRNLVGNAIKFTPQNGTIKVYSKLTNNMVHIAVEDNGIGITPEDKEKLFQMGKYSKKGTNQETGSGFGLWICKDFIEKNNGTIWVESELNQGSIFWFTLPLENS